MTKKQKRTRSCFYMSISSVFLAWGCQVQTADIDLSAAKSSNRHDYQVPLETSPSSGMILSSQLVSKRSHNAIRDNGRALFKAIAQTSIAKLYLVVEQGDPMGRDIDWKSIPDAFRNRIQLVEQSEQGKLMLWARDWSPLIAIRESSGAPVALDFNYHVDVVRGVEENSGSDSAPIALAQSNEWELVDIPVYSEGGNFLVDKFGRCHMTSAVVEYNSEKFREKTIALSSEDIVNYYEDKAGCTGVNIYPRMPYEITGHIDMWAKFLTEDTVAISQISSEQLHLVEGDLERALKAGGVRNYLEERSAEFQSQGFNVVRIPMPLPELDSTVFRTYANSLFANGHVIIPKYERGINSEYVELQDYEYIDAHLLEGYENQVAEIYQRHGYTPLFVNSDILISLKGAIHCVAMQVPQFESADSERWFPNRTFLQ